MATSGGIFSIVPQGPFSLRESATFGFGQRVPQDYDGSMPLAFCVDGYRTQAAVDVRQASNGSLTCRWSGNADEATVRRQVMRVLSLDFDATAYVAIGNHDAVIAGLLLRAPGLRPPLFYSPYEAAAWSVISARLRRPQASAIRAKLSRAHGKTFEDIAPGIASFPTPEDLLKIESFPGLPFVKVERLHAVARTALEGKLDISHIADIGPEAAHRELQLLPGIGPFYASLIVVRASGFADVLPEPEPTAMELVGRLYGLGAPATAAQLETIAQAWRPFRTWCLVLIRATSDRPPPDSTRP